MKSKRTRTGAELRHGDDPCARFVEIPLGSGMRHEPVVKGKGVPIWVLIAYVQQLGLTPREVSDQWEGEITPQEVEAALVYQQRFPEQVKNKLLEEV